jgi:hypothetical protein
MLENKIGYVPRAHPKTGLPGCSPSNFPAPKYLKKTKVL